MKPGNEIFELENLMERLWEETGNFAELADDAAITEVAHKTAYAKALLLAEGTEKAREAAATAKADDELLSRRLAEARLSTQKELLQTLRTEVDAIRTLNANARAIT